MNDTPMNRTDPELLISRIVDGEATPGDWAAFRALAEREPSLWRDLAEGQRAQEELAADVSRLLSVAGRVDVPVHSEMVRRLTGRIRLVGTWGGWLAAACIGLMWAQGNRAGGSSSVDTATTLPSALQAYLDRGQSEGKVIGELPEKMLVSATPVTESGTTNIAGYQIVYVRQILERTTVKDLYRFGADEAGEPRPVKVEIRRPASPM